VWGLADVLQNAAQTRSYLVVAADALNILAIVTDVEVVDGKVDQHALVARSSVELGEAGLILCRPRVILGHETAEVLLALGYGLLPEKPIGRSADPLLKFDNLVVLHMVECYTIGQAHLDLLNAF
jgi:hypothetical protein